MFVPATYPTAQAAKRSYTVAAFIKTGVISVSKRGLITARKNGGDAKVVKKALLGTAFNYWKAKERLTVEDGRVLMTAEGLNELSASMERDNGYQGVAEYIDGFLAAFEDGGAVEVAGTKYHFAKEV